MKLVCRQKQLLESLSLVQKAINPQNTLPILGNVLLHAEGQKLYLSATNLEIAITTYIPCEVKNEGKITVPAKILVSYIGYLKDEDIEIVLEDGGTLYLHSTRSKTRIKGISSEEFPVIPTVEKEETFVLPREELKNAIEGVVFCSSSSTTRPVLSGVYIWGKEKEVRFVATDSYRLGEKVLELKGKTFAQELKNIVPSRTMQELVRILSSAKEDVVEIVSSKNQILFQVGNTKLISRLIEGKFPDYVQIIPKAHKTQANMLISEFILGIKRVGIFAKENNNNIRFTFAKQSKTVVITTDATEIGSDESEVEAEVSGEDNTVALNGQYFLDVLQNIHEEKALVEIEGKLSPIVIKPEKEKGFTHVIMPLKI